MTTNTPPAAVGTPIEIVTDLGNGFTQITRMDIEQRDDLTVPDEIDGA